MLVVGRVFLPTLVTAVKIPQAHEEEVLPLIPGGWLAQHQTVNETVLKVADELIHVFSFDVRGRVFPSEKQSLQAPGFEVTILD